MPRRREEGLGVLLRKAHGLRPSLLTMALARFPLGALLSRMPIPRGRLYRARGLREGRRASAAVWHG